MKIILLSREQSTGEGLSLTDLVSTLMRLDGLQARLAVPQSIVEVKELVEVEELESGPYFLSLLVEVNRGISTEQLSQLRANLENYRGIPLLPILCFRGFAEFDFSEFRSRVHSVSEQLNVTLGATPFSIYNPIVLTDRSNAGSMLDSFEIAAVIRNLFYWLLHDSEGEHRYCMSADGPPLLLLSRVIRIPVGVEKHDVLNDLMTSFFETEAEVKFAPCFTCPEEATSSPKILFETLHDIGFDDFEDLLALPGRLQDPESISCEIRRILTNERFGQIDKGVFTSFTDFISAETASLSNELSNYGFPKALEALGSRLHELESDLDLRIKKRETVDYIFDLPSKLSNTLTNYLRTLHLDAKEYRIIERVGNWFKGLVSKADSRYIREGALVFYVTLSITLIVAVFALFYFIPATSIPSVSFFLAIASVLVSGAVLLIFRKRTLRILKREILDRFHDVNKSILQGINDWKNRRSVLTDNKICLGLLHKIRSFIRRIAGRNEHYYRCIQGYRKMCQLLCLPDKSLVVKIHDLQRGEEEIAATRISEEVMTWPPLAFLSSTESEDPGFQKRLQKLIIDGTDQYTLE